VPRAELVAAATQVAASLARQPIGALIATKRLMRLPRRSQISSRSRAESSLERLRSPEAGRSVFGRSPSAAHADFAEVRVNQGRNPSARNMTRRFFARAASVVRRRAVRRPVADRSQRDRGHTALDQLARM